MSNYEIHSLAACWCKPENYEELKASIKQTGQLELITLFEGKILDGVQRYRICCELGFEPRFESPDIEDPFAYVLAKNKNRRHVTKGQIAMAVAKMSKIQNGSNQFVRKSQDVVKTDPLRTIAELAKNSGVSRTEIERSKHIHRHGSPELIEAVSNGRISTIKAQRIAAKTESVPSEAQPDGAKISPVTKVHQDNQEAALLAGPSIYPLDAKIPQGGGEDERRLREAIKHLRTNEPQIPTYGRRKLDQKIYPFTQYIQAYVINRFQNPRTELLDPRIREWARNVAERMLVRRNHLLRQPEPEKIKESPGGFEGFWRSYWREESALLRRFPAKSFEMVKERWLAKATEIFRQKQSNAERLKLDRKKPAPAP